MKKLLSVVLLLFLVANLLYAQPKSIKPTSNWVAAKNYYLLYKIQNQTNLQHLLASDTALFNLLEIKTNLIKLSLKNCKTVGCFIRPLLFNTNEINTVNSAFTRLYKPGNLLDQLIKTQLKPSGKYNSYDQLNGLQFLLKAWQQDAAAINYTIGVYGEGKAPNYPKIDSISFNVNTKSYLNLIYDFNTVIGETANYKFFFQPSLNAALLFLQINHRERAADYEPMQVTVNHAAFMKVKTVDWKKYPYAVIVVPGAGPDDAITALSAEGMLRCKLAAQQFALGQAPFIMVSGGKVHPFKTNYCEAEEMKKYLIDQLLLPENVIIMEPHARHTTTNLRNAARLIHQYGIPFDKVCLIVTDKSQNDFIETMADRCIKELNYLPYRLDKRVSETALAFYPNLQSLQIDPDEPMDP